MGWLVTGEVALAAAALAALALLGLALRRRLLQRRGGCFDASLRTPPGSGSKGWTLGLARYSDDDLEWFRVFSYALRPRRTFPRRGLAVVSRRVPTGPEAFSLLAGSVVVECRQDGAPLELGMTEEALTGLLSWLEAAPPGRDISVA